MTILRSNYLTDREWCEAEVLSEISSCGVPYPEEYIYAVLCEDAGAGVHHIGWIRRGRRRRALIVAKAIEELILNRRIKPAPGLMQATGRRYFIEVNPLDAIVDAVDAGI